MRRKTWARWLLAVALLVACGGANANPLIGRWRLDAEASSLASTGVEMAGAEEIEFREHSVLSAGSLQKVEYEVESGQVLVSYPALGRGQVIRILDQDAIRMDLPMDEFIVYRRCGDDNGLLGRWRVDTQASHSAAIVPFEPVEAMEFANDEMRVELRSGDDPPPVPVDYRVECDVVTVTNPKVGESQHYRVLGPDRIEGINDQRPAWKLYLLRVD